MSKAKTRKDSASPLVNYLGFGKELVPSEVPTLRAALQLALFLQDQRWRLAEVNKRNYPLSELMQAVAKEVFVQWEKANYMLKPPILCTQSSMERRLLKEWERAKLAAIKKLGKAQQSEFEERLDKLLDPLR